MLGRLRTTGLEDTRWGKDLGRVLRDSAVRESSRFRDVRLPV